MFWGSTYLGIRIAIETFPPLLMAGVRFLVAGLILAAVDLALARGRVARPSARQWAAQSVIGFALLVCGNGGVTVAEQSVPSGIAALLVATVPLWMALLARLVLGEPLTRRSAAGLAVGFAGLVVLAAPSGPNRLDPTGTIILLVAPLLWAAGSIYSRRAPSPPRPLLGVAMQMVAAAVMLVVASAVHGELASFHPAQLSSRSLLATAYLVGFGSLVGFTAYVWLLRVAPTSLVATYAYVNPVVAVLLGWGLAGEAMTGRTVVAMTVIVLGVALIAGSRPRRRPAV